MSASTSSSASPLVNSSSFSSTVQQPEETGVALASRARVALVTGAAQGIGRSVALRLAKDGYKVAISDLPSQLEKLREVEREIVALPSTPLIGARKEPELESGTGTGSQEFGGRGVAVIVADVSREGDLKSLVEECVVQLGSLDVMVANAGIAIYKPLLELPVEEFDRVVSVNLRGAMLCYKYAAAQMVKQGRGGRIIGASSMYGKAGAPNLAGYCASKFGIRGLTHTAALEWGKYGITVNAYAPAAILTPMLEDYDTELTSTVPGMKQGDLLERIKARSPMGYLGSPTEIASLVAYLASPEAHYITGQTLSVNGGALVD